MTSQELLQPSRDQQLLDWLRPYLKDNFTRLQSVAGDASFRRYYRLDAKENQYSCDLIVMDAPPEKEASDRFLDLAQRWHQQGIAVPQVIQSDLTQGLALLEDFGDQQLMQAVREEQPEAADPLYRQALRQLAQLQTTDALQAQNLPKYDASLLHRELALFDEWLLEGLLALDLKQSPKRWPDFQQALIDRALAQPQTLVHRDYHSRNLMVRKDARPLGILDFQDAVLGPQTYDAVSLIRDCYLTWPTTHQQAWLSYFYQLTQPSISWADYQQDFDWMGMQRHLKAAGIFARLWLRDGKPQYLADLPRTLKHLTSSLQYYPQWADIHDWLIQVIEPAIKQRVNTREET